MSDTRQKFDFRSLPGHQTIVVPTKTPTDWRAELISTLPSLLRFTCMIALIALFLATVWFGWVATPA